MMQGLFKSCSRPLSLRVDGTDKDFDSIYPRGIRRMAEQHFTPLHVAKKASAFLASSAGVQVLDIGSGAGKFCLIGAATTTGCFVGVEQRKEMVSLSAHVASACGIDNVRFIHGNVITTRFDQFDAFYMYNPFYENAVNSKRMDDAVLVNPSLFTSYSAYTSAQLAHVVTGTRLATYYTPAGLIPNNFDLVESFDEGRLQHWIKR